MASLNHLERKLQTRLVPTANPFLGASDLADTASIFTHLSFDGSPHGPQANVLAKAREIVRGAQPLTRDSLTSLTRETLAYAISASSGQDRKPLFTALLSSEILRSLWSQVSPEPTESSSSENLDSEDPAPEETTQEKPDSSPPPPLFHPDLPEEYEVQSSDDSETDATSKLALYRFNEKARYFRQKAYSLVRRGQTNFQTLPMPGRIERSPPQRVSNLRLRVKTLGANKIELFYPEGFEPLQVSPSVGKITRLATDQYIMELISEGEEVEIPVAPRSHEQLTAPELEILTSPIGINEAEWPDMIRNQPFGDKASPLSIAEDIERFLKTSYLYSKKSAETDPIRALNSGKFKCDMAALIMMGLLRDRFSIPSRVVAGFHADRDKELPGPNSVLALPSEPHAWVEVYSNGAWHTFDPTPLKKAPDEDDDASNSDSQFVPQTTPEDAEADANAQPNQGQESKARKEPSPSDEGADEAAADDAAAVGSTNQDPGKAQGFELTGDAKVGSLSLRNQGSNGSFDWDFLRILLRESIAPQLGDADSLKNVEAFAQLKSPAFEAAVREARQYLRPGRPGAADALRAVAQGLRRSPPEDSYKEFHLLKRKIEAFESLLRPGDFAPEIIAALARLRLKLDRIDSGFRALEIAMADDLKRAIGFLKNLPPLTRAAVKSKYGISSETKDPALKTLSNALNTRELVPYELIRLVYPFANFITLPTETPRYKETKTWRYHPARRGRDYRQLEDLAHLSRAISMDPARSLEENWRSGDLLDPSLRLRAKASSNRGISDPERITIVAYDTSASLDGDYGDFQAALISAFGDRALSDRSPDGRHRHRLVLMGFDTGVHTVHIVNTAARAIDVIRNYRGELKNTGGGTDIMAALEEAFNQIFDAQKQVDEPLANANIVLLTDGLSSLSPDKIRAWRDQIDRSTKVQLIVGAIGRDIPELKALVESEEMRASLDWPGYFVFDAERIAGTIREANSPRVELDSSLLVTEVEPSQIPDSLRLQLLDAADLAQDLESRLKIMTLPTLKQFSRPVGTLASGDDNATALSAELQALRNTVQSARDSRVIHRAFLFWLLKFEKTLVRGVDGFTLREKAVFEHLLREVNALN